MRKHTPRDHVVQLEGIDDVLKRLFNAHDAVDRAVHGVCPDDNVARCIGERVEDLPNHVIGMICRRIGLDSRTHVSLCAHFGARQHIEDFLTQGDQLFIAHQFRDTADRVAGESVHHALNRRLWLSQEKIFQLAHGPIFDLCVLGLVGGLPYQSLKVVLEQWVLVEIPDLRICQKGAGIFPCCLIRSAHSNGLISFLEVIRSANHLLVNCLIKIPFDPVDIRKDVFSRLDLVDRNVCLAGCRLGSIAVACKGPSSCSHH